jgi:hypothetical protein
MVKPSEPEIAVTVLAQAAGAFMEQATRMTEQERKQAEKEITGLKAKLRWAHISDGIKETYRIRIEALEARLKEVSP